MAVGDFQPGVTGTIYSPPYTPKPQLSVVPVPFFGRTFESLDAALSFARGQVDTLLDLHARLGVPVPPPTPSAAFPSPPAGPNEGAFDAASRKLGEVLDLQHRASELLTSLEKSLI